MSKNVINLADGLQNLITGMGTSKDSRSHNTFVYAPTYNNWPELEAAYCENWIAREIVDAPVDDATREWREFSLQEESMDIASEETRLKVQPSLQWAFKMSGLYGGAGIIMLIKGQPLDQPLNLNRIKKGDLIGLRVFDRNYLTAMDAEMVDVLSGEFMLPTYYLLNGGKQRIHHSNVVRVPGAKLPMRLRGLNGFWDDSRLRRCLEDLKDVVSSKSGIAKLIQSANVDNITSEGLNAALAAGEEGDIVDRFVLFNFMKSCFGLGLLDAQEKYERNQIAFGGLGDILRAMMEWCSGAAGIPLTRLFGVQTKGLGNDTSGDLENYYNSIRSAQNSTYKHVLDKIDEVFIRSTLGYFPDGYSWKWRPLQQMDPTEIAQRQKTIAEKDDIRIAQGVPASAVLEKARADGEYDIDDEIIEGMKRNEKAEREGETAGRVAPEVEALYEEDEARK